MLHSQCCSVLQVIFTNLLPVHDNVALVSPAYCTVSLSPQVAAVVVPREGKDIILSELREWAKSHLAPYAIPTLLRCVDRLPKNALGKINKRELVSSMFPESSQQGARP